MNPELVSNGVVILFRTRRGIIPFRHIIPPMKSICMSMFERFLTIICILLPIYVTWHWTNSHKEYVLIYFTIYMYIVYFLLIRISILHWYFLFSDNIILTAEYFCKNFKFKFLSNCLIFLYGEFSLRCKITCTVETKSVRYTYNNTYVRKAMLY